MSSLSSLPLTPTSARPLPTCWVQWDSKLFDIRGHPELRGEADVRSFVDTSKFAGPLPFMSGYRAVRINSSTQTRPAQTAKTLAGGGAAIWRRLRQSANLVPTIKA
ncbi:hypothetical protein C8R45DRAFT_1073806 [Mycena sanguinolenta]|nr:hypothetical protein C8R45DRAFT_1073806 [Mycena sanguinolenta]